MKLTVAVIGTVLGLAVGGGAGSYWYLAQAESATADPAPRAADSGDHAFIDLERKFVVPLVRGNRVRSLVVVDLRLEVTSSAEALALELKPKLRDAFLDTLYAMAVAGAFDGDLYSNNVQGEMRTRLLEAARQVLRDGATAILISELLRQDQ
jgi:flagellar basal body-associated protein FliL